MKKEGTTALQRQEELPAASTVRRDSVVNSNSVENENQVPTQVTTVASEVTSKSDAFLDKLLMTMQTLQANQERQEERILHLMNLQVKPPEPVNKESDQDTVKKMISALRSLM